MNLKKLSRHKGLACLLAGLLLPSGLSGQLLGPTPASQALFVSHATHAPRPQPAPLAFGPEDTPSLALGVGALAFVAYQVGKDGGAGLNAFADHIEACCLGPLTWENYGNPITWVHHAAWTAGLMGVGAGIARLTGASAGKWARLWGGSVAGLYAIREAVAYDGSHKLDSLLDVAFPALTVFLLAR